MSIVPNVKEIIRKENESWLGVILYVCLPVIRTKHYIYIVFNHNFLCIY